MSVLACVLGSLSMTDAAGHIPQTRRRLSFAESVTWNSFTHLMRIIISADDGIASPDDEADDDIDSEMDSDNEDGAEDSESEDDSVVDDCDDDDEGDVEEATKAKKGKPAGG
eukprot:scaffold515408_cov22-Prasinocladus_malaysianus.AAC.1